MDQLNLTPLPAGRYFCNLFGADNQISDWALAQFFTAAARHFAGAPITVRVDPVMRDGQQHGWSLIAFPTAQQEETYG